MDNKAVNKLRRMLERKTWMKIVTMRVEQGHWWVMIEDGTWMTTTDLLKKYKPTFWMKAKLLLLAFAKDATGRHGTANHPRDRSDS